MPAHIAANPYFLRGENVDRAQNYIRQKHGLSVLSSLVFIAQIILISTHELYKIPFSRGLAEVKMPFVKVVKNKAYFKRFQVCFILIFLDAYLFGMRYPRYSPIEQFCASQVQEEEGG